MDRCENPTCAVPVDFTRRFCSDECAAAVLGPYDGPGQHDPLEDEEPDDDMTAEQVREEIRATQRAESGYAQ